MANNNRPVQTSRALSDAILFIRELNRKCHYTPYKRLSDLEPEKIYKVREVASCIGKHGRCIILRLNGCQIVLPKRYEAEIGDEQVKLLNSNIGKIFLTVGSLRHYGKHITSREVTILHETEVEGRGEQPSQETSNPSAEAVSENGDQQVEMSSETPTLSTEQAEATAEHGSVVTSEKQ